MSIQSEIDRLTTIKANLKAAINGASGATVGDVFGDYPGAITSGKAAIATAITEKGVETAADATFQQMAENIGAIETGSTLAKFMVSVMGSAAGNIFVLDQEKSIFIQCDTSPKEIALGNYIIAYTNAKLIQYVAIQQGNEYITNMAESQITNQNQTLGCPTMPLDYGGTITIYADLD